MNSNTTNLNKNSIVTNNTNNKSPFLKNFTQFFKKGSNALGEKLGHLFKKKEKSVEENRMNGKFAIVKEKNTNNPNMNFVANANFNKINENKQIFKIEEDEEGKEKIYHLEDDDDEDEDEDDYLEDEEDSNYENEKEKESIQADKINSVNREENKGTAISNLDKAEPNENKTGLNVEKKETEASSQQLLSHLKAENIPKEDSIDWTESNYDLHTVVHRIYYKGSPININDLPLIKFSKIKNKSNLLSMMGISRKLEQKNYLAFFDENYLYFLKDIEIDKKDKNIRKIGNKINLNLFYNANIGNLENNGIEYVHITLEFLKESNSEDTILKDLYFEERQAERFVNLLDIYLRRLNIQLFEEDNYRRNTQESDDNEIYKKDNEDEDEMNQN